MRLPRFKIRTLLGVVLCVAIVLAAVRAADDLWDSGALGLTSLYLLTAVLLAVHRTDRKRAFWLGFALFGWAYLVASLIPSIELRLPTTMGLIFMDSKIPGLRRAWVVDFPAYTNTAAPNPVQSIAFSHQGHTLASSSQKSLWLWDNRTGELLAGPDGTTDNCIRIGHSLLALLLAFVGGHLSRHLHGRGREDSSHPPSNSPDSP